MNQSQVGIWLEWLVANQVLLLAAIGVIITLATALVEGWRRLRAQTAVATAVINSVEAQGAQEVKDLVKAAMPLLTTKALAALKVHKEAAEAIYKQ